MPDNELIRILSERLVALMPVARELKDQARARVEEALKAGLAELNVPTREEFESQARALRRAEERLAEMEKTIAGLEALAGERQRR